MLRRRSKSTGQYEQNLSMASQNNNAKIKGKVTDHGHSIGGKDVGKNTLNRRLNGLADFDVSYKVLLLGDSGVGKTALLEHVTGKPFMPHHLTTVGIDFVKKIFDVDGARVQLQIWDTAGQERFRTMTKLQYRGAKGVLLLYDITDAASFDMLDYWLGSIDEEVDGSNTEPVPVYIVGNKCDLHSDRLVPEEQGRKAAARSYCRGFYETSAKNGDNVNAVFYQLAQSIVEVYDPKLLDSFLSPADRKEKYDRQAGSLVCNGQCACGGIPPQRGSFKLKPHKHKKNAWRKCFRAQ